jgi:hypothetical protein
MNCRNALIAPKHPNSDTRNMMLSLQTTISMKKWYVVYTLLDFNC